MSGNLVLNIAKPNTPIARLQPQCLSLFTIALFAFRRDKSNFSLIL